MSTWTELLDLTHDLHETADRLGATITGLAMRVAAQNTAICADLVQSGKWDPEAGRAWVEATRDLLTWGAAA